MSILNNMNLKRNFIGFKTIFLDEVKRFLQIWPQTLFASAVTILLYFIIFDSILRLRFISVGGLSYLVFLAPGFIVMGVITNAYGNVSFSIATHRFQRSIEEIIISPMPNFLILFAYMVSGTVRGLLVGCIIAAISLFFIPLNIKYVGLSLLCLTLIAAVFSLAGFINAIYARRFDDVILIPIFILTPLIYLGGVFAPYERISPFWQTISQYNPIYYMVSIARYSITGYLDASLNVPQAIGFIVLTLVILWLINIYMLRKRVGIEA